MHVYAGLNAVRTPSVAHRALEEQNQLFQLSFRTS
jgi:hypothetical protein